METIYIIALVLLILGGINWALIGLFDFNVVGALFGDLSGASRTIYTVVGACAIIVAVLSSWSPERGSAPPTASQQQR